MSDPLKGSMMTGNAVRGKMRRMHIRTQAFEIVCDIADGRFVFEASVDDISSGGMKISRLPPAFSASKQSYRTIISAKDRRYRIHVFPCWTKKDKKTKTIEAGFKIVDASWEWEAFVVNAMSEKKSEKGADFNV